MKRSMLVAGLSLLAGCGGADGGYGGAPGDAGPAEDDAEARDVAPLEVGSAVSCEDPDRPGQALTRPCSSACGEGVERCAGNRWQACDARQPVAEDCRTAIDDDCDGVVNEDCGECAPGATRPCPSGPAPVGECRTGVQTCGGDRAWGACVGERRPAEEQCNGADDDCDGAVDDGLVRMCTNGCGAGMQACVAGAWSACTGRSPSPEACNGVDDDCDGSVDEDVTRACSTACGAGVQRCTGGSWGACSARQPEAEVCNGVDDDCDGLRDEGLTRSCASACGSGSQTCSGGFWGACSAPSPGREVCDLRDNDCNGRVDEGLTASFPIRNLCVRSPLFVAFGGCNACRSTCRGDWINPGRTLSYELMQNTCYYISMMVRTPRGDVCIDREYPSGRYVGEVNQLCNEDCFPFPSHDVRCISE